MRRILLALLVCACNNGKPAPKPPATPANVSATRDFVSDPLQFKAWYGLSGPDDYEGNSNHVMNDDVINTRTLTWSAGDSSTF